jgi:tetratricopeptide (TPR) repeat protein
MSEEYAALPLYQRATELDPNFAMAYARLGTVYMNLGQSELAEKSREKAFELRDRASEHEKLYIISHYYTDSGQLDKGIQALELYKQTYPRDSIPYNNLAIMYNSLGQFQSGLENARVAVQLENDNMGASGALALAYAGLNRSDEAKAAVQQMLQHKSAGSSAHEIAAGLAFAQNDLAAAERELELAKTGPEGEMNVAGFRLGIAAARGKGREARQWGQKMREEADRLSLKEASAAEYAQQALVESIFQQKDLANEDAAEALKLSSSFTVVMPAATAIALSGNDSRALKMADEVAARRPNDTLVHFVSVPTIRAIAELNHGNTAKAIDILDGSMVYARANTTVLYVRGSAYLKAGDVGNAVQTFQQLISMKAYTFGDPLISLSHLGLARAYAAGKDTVNSRLEYQNFLALWKDADSDMPPLRQAQAEYAKLQ